MTARVHHSTPSLPQQRDTVHTARQRLALLRALRQPVHTQRRTEGPTR